MDYSFFKIFLLEFVVKLQFWSKSVQYCQLTLLSIKVSFVILPLGVAKVRNFQILQKEFKTCEIQWHKRILMNMYYKYNSAGMSVNKMVYFLVSVCVCVQDPGQIAPLSMKQLLRVDCLPCAHCWRR